MAVFTRQQLSRRNRPISSTPGGDEFTLSIGNARADGMLVQDYLKAWNPEDRIDSDVAVQNSIQLLKRYHVEKVFSDRTTC